MANNSVEQMRTEIKRLIRPYIKPGYGFRKHLTSEEIEELFCRLMELARE